MSVLDIIMISTSYLSRWFTVAGLISRRIFKNLTRIGSEVLLTKNGIASKAHKSILFHPKATGKIIQKMIS